MRHDIVEELFRKYYNDLLLYALTLTKNKADADELVSEAFFKALETADGKVQNFKAWLFRICRNTFLNKIRREKRITELSDAISDESEQAVDRIIKDESYQALYRAIELLPDTQREVITLFYFEEMKLADIAEIIGKSAEYTKLILFRGREGVKKILEVRK